MVQRIGNCGPQDRSYRGNTGYDPGMPATVAAESTDALTAYQWEPQPKAAAFVRRVVDDFLAKLPEAAAFADRLYRETGNRFADLIDTIHIPDDEQIIHEIERAGWKEVECSCFTVWRNESGMFPKIACDGRDPPFHWITLKVESVGDFFAANGLRGRLGHELCGDPGQAWRTGTIVDDYDSRVLFDVIERHGSYGWVVAHEPDVEAIAVVRERFRLRSRDEDEDEEFALRALDRLVDGCIDRVGRDVACDLFFAAEREYWQRRNAAARFQKARQDALGIGWANHDHHTYRSSRRHFHRLVALWEKLGFECRERFYPGPAAGWGAQVMEQPVCGIVTFNDVDISEEEMRMDFAHEPMEERDHLGTVGLWCGLHGESVLQAGMHHLECTFDFDALEQQMKAEGGIDTMPKFTDFPHLKQAFTKGERWAVDPARIDALLAKNLITEHQAKEFRKHGAIGSHLENLERNDGFKGFNQTGVTDIIARTDPRRQG